MWSVVARLRQRKAEQQGPQGRHRKNVTYTPTHDGRSPGQRWLEGDYRPDGEPPTTVA